MTLERTIRIILIIALVAVVVWALLAFVPMPYPFGTLIVVVAIILVILGLIREVGGIG